MNVRNPDTDMVYRGDECRIHIADGMRVDTGTNLADHLSRLMRTDAHESGVETWDDAFGFRAKSLCPGCYMTAGFNMLVTLARENGQSLRELGRTMALAFTDLANGGPEQREEVRVVLDDEQEPAQPETHKDDNLPYLDGFMPNDDPELARRTLERLPVTERDFIMGLTSYGLDLGLLR